MYIDKLIRKEVITLIISVSLLIVLFIGVTYSKFLSVDNGSETVINIGDLSISFCNDSTCDSTYNNIGQIIGSKIVDGVSVPVSMYPYKNDGSYSKETPYIFKVENDGTLDSTIKIKLKEDISFIPSGDYSNYERLTSKYADHLKIAIRKKITYGDTGYQLGDTNLDGIINKEDVDLINSYINNETTFSTLQKTLADINEDGTIDSNDSVLLNNNIIGISSNSNLKINVYKYSELEDGTIYQNESIALGQSATYFLWLYLDETTPNDVQNTFFVASIDVESEYSISVPEPENFSTDSWATIANAVKTNNISKYNVGDTRKIDLENYGTHTLRIANTSTPSECSTEEFSQSACGFVLEFVDIITTHNINPTGTYNGKQYNSGWSKDGWPATSMRTFVNNDIYNSLPADLKSVIIDTIVVSSHGSEDSSNFTSTDKLYLLSTAELWAQGTSSKINNDSARSATKQLDYYKNLGVTTTNRSAAVKKSGTTASYWWLRSANSGVSTGFYRVGTSGEWSNYFASYAYGVSPAFRIG